MTILKSARQMKKLLPVSSNKGFTLIELLVAITIISVLAVMGFAAFGGLSGRGNDSRRSADMKAVADALEVKRTNALYQSIALTDFATGKAPTEPTGRTEKYCYVDGAAAIANPIVWTGSACPASGGWANIDGVVPTVAGCPAACTATFFKVCTVNEAKTAVICYGSRQ